MKLAFFIANYYTKKRKNTTIMRYFKLSMHRIQQVSKKMSIFALK